jgi:hypothetical protein
MTRDTATFARRRYEQLRRPFMSRWSQTEYSFEGIRVVLINKLTYMQGFQPFRTEVLEDVCLV